MKKLIAIVLSVTVLLAFSAISFAVETTRGGVTVKGGGKVAAEVKGGQSVVSEVESQEEPVSESEVESKPESKPESSIENAHDKFENILVTRADEMEKLQEQFQDLKAKIEAKRAQIEEKKAAFATKRDEFKAYKDVLKEKRQKMIDLKQEGNALFAENAKLRGELKAAIVAIEEDQIELPAETKTAIEEGMAQIKDLTENIKETKGQIHEILKGMKELKENRDYVSLEVSFEEIYTIQLQRNANLKQINDILKGLLQLLVTEA